MKMQAALVAVAALAFVGSAQAQSFSEGFETAIPVAPNGPPGTTIALPSGNWFAYNNSSPIGASGVFTSSLFVPHGGALHAAMNFQNGSGLATLDTYFETPVVTLNNGDTLSFWTRTTDGTFPDRLIIKLSTSGAATTPASFTTTMLTINPTLAGGTAYPNVWTQFTVTVSGLGGPTSGRFAFNYNVTGGGPSGANSDFIGIDDVQYTAVPAPGAFALLGLAGVFGARRRRRD
jgi:MYXO-CTERM domain-containing protein